MCSEESPTATISTHLQQTSKVKSAETNVKVSLQIVNEVENTNVTRKSNESLDIVEEELAKMAVAGMHLTLRHKKTAFSRFFKVSIYNAKSRNFEKLRDLL